MFYRVYEPFVGKIAAIAVTLLVSTLWSNAWAEQRFRTILDPATVSWEITQEFKQADLLVVTPDDEYLRHKFTQGEYVIFDGPFPSDGLYKFEIALTPVISDETRARMMEARRTGDKRIMRELRESGELPSGPMRFSGSFRVHEGGIVVAGEDTEEQAPLKLN